MKTPTSIQKAQAQDLDKKTASEFSNTTIEDMKITSVRCNHRLPNIFKNYNKQLSKIVKLIISILRICPPEYVGHNSLWEYTRTLIVSGESKVPRHKGRFSKKIVVRIS